MSDFPNGLTVTGTLSASDSIRGGSGATYKFALDYSVSGDVAGELANSHASGYGYRIKGGTTSNYALLVQSQDSTNIIEAKKGAVTVIGAITSSTTISTVGIGLNVAPTTAGTSRSYVLSKNTGGDFYFGQEGSVAGAFFTGAAAYDSVLYSSNPINIIVNGAKRGTFSSTGLAVTGALSATANVADSVSALINTDTANGNGLYIKAGGVNAGKYALYIENGSGTGLATLDTSGNLGLGVTPSAWDASFKALQIRGSGIMVGSTGNTYQLANAYFDGAYKYSASSFALKYEMVTGGHSWYTAPSGTAGNAITFTQSLAVGLGTTLALEGATSGAGTGIAFPATQVASSNANTLDDYEEGTFTPTIAGASTSGVGTYSSQSGTYTKVGRLVTIQINLFWSAHTGTGAMRIDGLPFTAMSAAGGYGWLSGYSSNITLTASNSLLGAEVAGGGTFATFYQGPVGGGAASTVALGTAGGIEFTGHYFV